MSLYIAFNAGRAEFFDSRLGKPPAGAAAITDARHAALLAGQATGQVIVADANGKPILTDPAPVPAPVPPAISRFQARAALHTEGLLDKVEAAVKTAEPLVQIAYADAVEWWRDSQMVTSLGAALKLTPKKIDDLFRQAATITA